jgi:hypothetical protein
MADEKVIIQLDLDASDYKKEFDTLEQESVKASENIGRAFNKEVAESIDETTKNISSLAETAAKVGAFIAAVTPVVIVLEKQFGVFSDILSKVGIDLDKLLGRFQSLKDSFSRFTEGEESVTGLKIALGGFLQELNLIDSKALKLIGGFADFTRSLDAIGVGFDKLVGASIVLVPILRNLREITQVSAGLANIFFGSKGIFGITSSLSAISIGLVAVGESLKETDSQAARAIGSLSTIAGILTGSLAAGITFAIVKFGEFATELGSRLVAGFQKVSESANKTEQSIIILSKVVENFDQVTSQAIGSTDSWEKSVTSLSNSLNLSQTELRKSAQEIVSVGSQLGFTQQELQKLLKISAEYAKVNNKDVFQSTLAVVNGLQGNAQALQAYGVKLNQASIQQFAFEKGLTESLDKLSQSELVQLRYSKLLKSYNNIAGIAAVTAGTLADQQNALAVNVERVNAELGKGARIIEQNNILNAALSSILDNVSNSVLQVTGFFGALGARILQVGGFLLKISFQIFAVVKAVKALNLVLSSDLGIRAFQQRLPLVNKSLNELLGLASQSEVRISSLNSLVKALGGTLLQSANSFTNLFLGVNASSIKFGNIISLIFKRVKLVFPLLISSLKSVLIIAGPFLAKFLLIGAAIETFRRAFVALEERTGVFSQSWSIIVAQFEKTSPLLASVKNLFSGLKDIFQEIGGRILGLVVAGLGNVFRALAFIVKNNPFGVFSDDVVVAVSKIDASLAKLNNDLFKVGFNLNKLPDDVARAVAGTNNAVSQFDFEAFAQLQKDFENFGKSDLQLLEEEFRERQELINQALQQEGAIRQQAQQLQTQVTEKFARERFNILNKEAIETAKAVTRAINQGLVSTVSRSLQFLGKSLVEGGNFFEGFLAVVLDALGNLAISIGTTVISSALAIDALKASLFGSAAIAVAAGAALIAIGGALKAFAGQVGGEGGASFGAQTSGAAGGGTAAFGQDDETLAFSEQEERQTQSTVNVNVQGDVLDSDETGLRIVELINQGLERDGAIVVREA